MDNERASKKTSSLFAVRRQNAKTTENLFLAHSQGSH
jgi:hypothetical protein